MAMNLNARYKATPPTIADGSVGELQLDVNGNLKIIAGIGDANGLYVSSFAPTRINTATTTVVKGTPGVLHSVIVNTKGTIASTITIYNNTSAAGAIVAIIDSLNLSGTFLYDITMSLGITVVTTGTVAPDVTVTYR